MVHPVQCTTGTVTVQVKSPPEPCLQMEGSPPAQTAEMAALAALVMSVRSETTPSQDWMRVLQVKVGGIVVCAVTPEDVMPRARRMAERVDFMVNVGGEGRLFDFGRRQVDLSKVVDDGEMNGHDFDLVLWIGMRFYIVFWMDMDRTGY